MSSDLQAVSVSTGETRPDRPQRRFLTGRGRIRGWRIHALVLLFLVPLIIVALKLGGGPWGQELERVLSLSGLDSRTGHRIASILFVPLAAVLVVFFRVGLGIRVLGPFRSFLLAMAFQAAGIPLGLLFLTFAIATIVVVRKPLKSFRLPYYGRVSVVMSIVAVLIALSLMLGRFFGLAGLHRVIYFPIVALCLMGDAFSNTIRREGLRSALWRGFATAAVAVLIAYIAGIPGFESALVRFPELLILEIGLIIVIAEFFGYRLLSSLNPPPVRKKKGKRKKSRKAKSRNRAAGAAHMPGASRPPVPASLAGEGVRAAAPASIEGIDNY